jgi:uncharacterized membrane protein YedE/YeeE
MIGLSPVVVGLAGFCIGVVAGFAVRRSRLCFLGAIESALVGRDWRRMKIFGLALAVALICTQAIIAAGLFDPIQSSYIPSRIAWLSLASGSILFGLGMALVGTCAFGSLVRLGGGDLRSLVTLLIFGLMAYATLRGILAEPRVTTIESINFEMPNGTAGSLFDALAFQLRSLLPALSGNVIRMLLAALLAAPLILATAFDRRLRRAPRLLVAGVLLGFCVAGGWIFTGVLADEFESGIRVQSLTFVAPVARALYAVLLASSEWMDFGVTVVFGTLAGSAAAALYADEFRWEAFDDDREMRKHLLGAVLMGVGGVLAGGCTVGQGLTAGSLLAVSWLITVPGIICGAYLGLTILVEGSIKEALSNRIRSRSWQP